MHSPLSTFTEQELLEGLDYHVKKLVELSKTRPVSFTAISLHQNTVEHIECELARRNGVNLVHEGRPGDRPGDSRNAEASSPAGVD